MMVSSNLALSHSVETKQDIKENAQVVKPTKNYKVKLKKLAAADKSDIKVKDGKTKKYQIMNCPFCDEAYTRKDRFDRHVFSHTKEVKKSVIYHRSDVTCFRFRKNTTVMSSAAQNNTQMRRISADTKEHVMRRSQRLHRSAASSQTATKCSPTPAT